MVVNILSVSGCDGEEQVRIKRSRGRWIAAVAVAASILPATMARAAAPSCPANACVVFDGTHPVRPVSYVAAGLTGSVKFGLNNDKSDLSALHNRMYRSSPPANVLGLGYDWTGWQVATDSGSTTTMILSDLWAISSKSSHPPTPWSNWGAYTAWVKSTVQTIESGHHPVNYWEVYNEPGWYDYYAPADFQQETPGELLQQFLVTYNAIKSVDPNAAIVGPSIGEFATRPLPANDPKTHEPDINTFLQFCAQHHLRLAAVALHDNNKAPATIYNDLRYTRSAMNKLPALGHPKLFLDEYASRTTQPIPGWDVGFIQAIEYSGADWAARSCWDSCFTGDLDGLLAGNGQYTTPEYFDRLTYAQMQGYIIKAASTSPTVTLVGSTAAAGHQAVALIGRDAGCANPDWCADEWFPSTTKPAPPISVQVAFVVPWTHGIAVHLSRELFEPNQISSGPGAAPYKGLSVKVTSTKTALVTFTIPSMPDGSAYNLVITGH